MPDQYRIPIPAQDLVQGHRIGDQRAEVVRAIGGDRGGSVAALSRWFPLRLVKFCTRRFRGNAVAASPVDCDARTRESWRQVRELLMEWDLIGVADIQEAADEYDCMISPLLHRLFEGADTRSLADWISRERISHFGAGPGDAGTHAARRIAHRMVGTAPGRSLPAIDAPEASERAGLP
jgi:hypothetical protein